MAKNDWKMLRIGWPKPSAVSCIRGVSSPNTLVIEEPDEEHRQDDDRRARQQEHQRRIRDGAPWNRCEQPPWRGLRYGTPGELPRHPGERRDDLHGHQPQRHTNDGEPT